MQLTLFNAARQLVRTSERQIHTKSRLATEAAPPAAASNPPKTEQASYPFSKKVRIINGATKPSGPLMHFVNEHLISTSEDKNVAEHVNMFRRSNPNVVTPGSVLSVSFYNNPARTNTTAFTGVVLAIKRRGVDTSFVLRSVVARTGVEVRFNAASNMIQEIKVAARADLSKADQQVQGRLPRARRAKLYYLRDQPQRMPRLASKG